MAVTTITAGARSAFVTANPGDDNGEVITLDAAYPYVEVTIRTDTTAAIDGYLLFQLDSGNTDQHHTMPALANPNGSFYVGFGMSRREHDDTQGGASRQSIPPNSVVRVVASTALAYVVTGCDGP